MKIFIHFEYKMKIYLLFFQIQVIIIKKSHNIKKGELDE